MIIVMNTLTITAILRLSNRRSEINYLLFYLALGDLMLGVTLTSCESAPYFLLQSLMTCKFCVLFSASSISILFVTILFVADIPQMGSNRTDLTMVFKRFI